MSKKAKKYTAQEKCKVAFAALKGELTYAQISSEYGVHTTQINRWKKQRHDWCDLKTIAMVESRVFIGDKTTTEQRYFISSLLAQAEPLALAVRRHWAIENSLHWVLDVTMGEDLSRVRKEHAPENMSMVRHIVLNLLQAAKPQFRKDLSLKGLQKKAGWGEKTLSTILMQPF